MILDTLIKYQSHILNLITTGLIVFYFYRKLMSEKLAHAIEMHKHKLMHIFIRNIIISVQTMQFNHHETKCQKCQPHEVVVLINGIGSTDYLNIFYRFKKHKFTIAYMNEQAKKIENNISAYCVHTKNQPVIYQPVIPKPSTLDNHDLW